MNKRGSEQVFSIWYFFCLIFIGSGAIIILIDYVGEPIDVNAVEASILENKIMSCITEQGFLVEGIFSDSFDAYSFCHLNQNVDRNKGGSFYFEANFTNETGQQIRAKKLILGNTAYATDCDVSKEKVAKYYPDCIYRNESYFYLDSAGNIKKAKLQILAASNNQGERKFYEP